MNEFHVTERAGQRSHGLLGVLRGLTVSCGVLRGPAGFRGLMAQPHTQKRLQPMVTPQGPLRQRRPQKSSFLNCPLLCAQRPCGAQGPREPHDEAVREERGGTLGSGESAGRRPAHGSRCVDRTEAWAMRLGLGPRDCPLWPVHSGPPTAAGASSAASGVPVCVPTAAPRHLHSGPSGPRDPRVGRQQSQGCDPLGPILLPCSPRRTPMGS